MNIFFSHENEVAPPSLSENGELRSAKSRSDIVDCLFTEEHTKISFAPLVDVKIIDGPVLVKIHKQQTTTFKDYANNVLMSYIKNQLNSFNRVDVVWDAISRIA